MRPTVSVVVPTYNYGRFIGEALESAIKQTYPPAEVIVVDDGSTDDTAEVVSRFGDRVRYLRQENAGVSAARNRGVAESGGDIIAFLDADDVWDLTKLEKQIERFTADPEVGLVHCGMREYDDRTGETIALYTSGGKGWVADRIALWEGAVVIAPGGTVVVRRDVFDSVGDFDTRLKYGEDWEFCFRVARRYKIDFLPEPLLEYRNHGRNATRDVSEMERSTLIAWAKVFDTDDEDIKRVRRRSYGNLFRALAGSYFRAGDLNRFLLNGVRGVYYRPSIILSFLGFPLRRLKRWRQS